MNKQNRGAIQGSYEFDGGYTGKDLDLSTGLVYMWNRWQDPSTGAFISEAPIQDGLNWYGYASANPLKYTDPTGLWNTDYFTMRNGSPLAKSQWRKENTFLLVVRNIEKGYANDTMYVMEGDETVATFHDVQSEKNYFIPPQTEADRDLPDYSDPNFPNDTLPEGEYQARRIKGGNGDGLEGSKYDKPLRISSKTIKLLGLQEAGVYEFFGFLIHSRSMIKRHINGAASLGCQILKDKDKAVLDKIFDDAGTEIGDIVRLVITSDGSAALKVIRPTPSEEQ